MRTLSQIFFLLFVVTCCSTSVFAIADGPKTTREEYINQWKDEAIYQMVMHKIPASITLAQGILESGDGNSRLATEANNHFGIKCHTDWKGAKIYEDDDAKSECFRKYEDAKSSYEDHSIFLQRQRYESLFKLKTDDYKGWAKGLKECGYATNPKYPELLIKLIEEWDLAAYDEIGTNHIKKGTVPDRKNSAAVAQTQPDKKERKPRAKNDGAQEERQVITLGGRTIEKSKNRIKYVVAQAGDTPEKIAASLEMNAWQIKKYNDLKELNTTFKAGEIVYIQPKRNKGSESHYGVEKGDDLWSISQKTGVKIKALKKWNPNINWSEIKPGEKIKLKQ